MAYRYNERTGEFEDVPKPAAKSAPPDTEKAGCLSAILRILFYMALPYIIYAVIALLGSLFS